MQIAWVSLIILACAVGAGYGFFQICRQLFKHFDSHAVVKRARNVEREAFEREAKMRKYSMSNLQPVKSQHER